MKKIKCKYRLFLFFLLSILLLFPCRKAVSASPRWLKHGPIIHACGMLNRFCYTNSVEALQNTLNLKKSRKYLPIEIDFILTSDDKLVCAHDWRYHNRQNNIDSSQKMDYKTYKTSHTIGGFTPLTGEQAINMLARYRNTYLVVDTKDDDIVRIYQKLVAVCKKTGHEDFLRRVIVQVYHFNEYKKIKRVYHFRHYIFAAYEIDCYRPKKIKKIMKFAKKNHMEAVKIPLFAFIEIKNKYRQNRENMRYIMHHKKLPVIVHSVNSQKISNILKNNGVDYIFTDTLFVK